MFVDIFSGFLSDIYKSRSFLMSIHLRTLPVRKMLLVFSFLFLSFVSYSTTAQTPTFLGTLPNMAHEVGGKVYALDDRTLLIKNLKYDGLGPDAYFWVGTSGHSPRSSGIKVPDENGSLEPLKAYRNAEVTLRLPDNLTLRDIKYFGLWCRRFRVDFGHIKLNQK